MPAEEAKKLIEEMEKLNPYNGTTGMVVHRVARTFNAPNIDNSHGWDSVESFFNNMLSTSRDLIMYWTPLRIRAEVHSNPSSSLQPTTLRRELQAIYALRFAALQGLEHPFAHARGDALILATRIRGQLAELDNRLAILEQRVQLFER